MTTAIKRDPIYRRRRFSVETIELCVRWYITYRLSYCDLVAMVAEQGVTVSHTTILRWVLRYVPEFEKRWARYARPVNPPPGAWTRPPSPCEAGNTTCIGQSTKGVSPSPTFCAQIAVVRRRGRFSERR
jgi:hypothetical protein